MKTKTIEEAAVFLSNNNVLSNINWNYTSELERLKTKYYDGFKAGAEFAQRWISVEDELPDFDKSKYPNGDFEVFLVRMSTGSISPKVKYCVANLIAIGRWSCEFDWNVVTHWRPIELK